jgi:hypothetical protein
MPQNFCDFAQFGDFLVTLFDGQPEIEAPARIEVALAAPNGANRLFIFSGIANAGLQPKQNGVMRRGIVEIALDLELGGFLEMFDGAAYIGLAGHQQHDVQTDYELACVEVRHGERNGRRVPVVRCAVGVNGTADANGTIFTRIAYQANIQCLVAFNFLVATESRFRPPIFASSATVTAGQPYLGRLEIPVNAPAPITFALRSLDPTVPVPATLTIPAQHRSVDIAPPMQTQHFATPGEKDVAIIANLGTLTSTATLKVLAG